MIEPTLDTFLASDGYRGYFRRYLPAGRPRGRIVYLHGIQSHGGWYTPSCQRLAAAGFAVYFLERRGSGLNTAHRGDMPSFRRLLDDIGEFVRALPADGTPRLALAVSWGGRLAVGLPYRFPGLVQGLALLAPGLFPVVRPALPYRLRIALAGFLRPTKGFPIPLNDPDLFTAVPHWQDYIAHDPRMLREVTARFLVQNVLMNAYLMRAGRRIHEPTLLMLAGRDRIIDNRRTSQFVGRFPSLNKHIVCYADAQHTLEFEADPEEYLRDLLAWVERWADGGPR